MLDLRLKHGSSTFVRLHLTMMALVVCLGLLVVSPPAAHAQKSGQSCWTSFQDFRDDMADQINEYFGHTPGANHNWSNDPDTGGHSWKWTTYWGELYNLSMGSTCWEQSGDATFDAFAYTMFFNDLSGLADKMGTNIDDLMDSGEDTLNLLAKAGVLGDSEFVDLGEDTPYTATVYEIASGEHKGEYLLVVKDEEGNPIYANVYKSKRAAKKAGRDASRAAGANVVEGPDGCGDVRLGGPGMPC